MQQEDSIHVYSDSLYYDGLTMKAQLQSNLQTSRPEENTPQQNTHRPQQAQQKTILGLRGLDT